LALVGHRELDLGALPEVHEQLVDVVEDPLGAVASIDLLIATTTGRRATPLEDVRLGRGPPRIHEQQDGVDHQRTADPPPKSA
jgi:hypothetical protein